MDLRPHRLHLLNLDFLALLFNSDGEGSNNNSNAIDSSLDLLLADKVVSINIEHFLYSLF